MQSTLKKAEKSAEKKCIKLAPSLAFENLICYNRLAV